MNTINELETTYQVEQIQLFLDARQAGIADDKREFSANVMIHFGKRKGILQIGTDGSYSIPESHLAYWSNETEQDLFSQIDADWLAEKLELSSNLAELKDSFQCIDETQY